MKKRHQYQASILDKKGMLDQKAKVELETEEERLNFETEVDNPFLPGAEDLDTTSGKIGYIEAHLDKIAEKDEEGNRTFHLGSKEVVMRSGKEVYLAHTEQAERGEVAVCDSLLSKASPDKVREVYEKVREQAEAKGAKNPFLPVLDD
jgi:hypothetical protein